MNVVVRHKGQFTLPADIRREANVEAGDCYAVFVRGEDIVLRPVTHRNGNGNDDSVGLPAEWVTRIEKSIEDLENGLVTVYEDDTAFLNSLDR